ncbi:MAG: tetratricopeptide repeat protein [Pseudomonadota bacterium]
MRLNIAHALPLLLVGIGLAAYAVFTFEPAPLLSTSDTRHHATAAAAWVPAPSPENAAVIATAAPESAPDTPQLRALADEGARLFAARRFTEAAEKLLPAADAGYPQAQYQMGWMNYLGFGVAKDMEQAVAWFRRAADQGNVDGMNALGTALREGKGAEQSYSDALHWYRAAAEQGHPEGEVNIGFMHEMGYATAKDPALAARYYRLAAAQNHATAQLYLASLFEEGKGLPQDLDSARGWYRRAAAQGNEYARLALERLEGRAPATVPNPAAAWAGER